MISLSVSFPFPFSILPGGLHKEVFSCTHSLFYVHVCVRAHRKGSFPAFSLIDVTSLLPDRVALMHSMLQFVSVPENLLLNTHTHKRTQTWPHAHTLCFG